MFDMLTGVMTFAFQAGDVADAAAEVAEEAKVAAAKALPAAAEAANLGVGATFAIFVTGLILSFILGAFLAKAMRVTDWGFRFGVCIAALAIGVMPFVVRMINGETLGQGIHLGIDLAGGTNMVFQVEPEDGKELTDEIMDKMVGAIGKRINPGGTSEITVRQVGRDRLEVIIPGEDPQTVNDIKRQIVTLGSLEFFITVDDRYDDATMIREASALSNDATKLQRTLANGRKEVYAMWLPAFEKGDRREPKLLDLNNTVKRSVEKVRTIDGKSERYTTEEYLVLVGREEEQVSGKYLKRAGSAIDSSTGRSDGDVCFQFPRCLAVQPTDGQIPAAAGLRQASPGHCSERHAVQCSVHQCRDQ